jgi:hypothetical protein
MTMKRKLIALLALLVLPTVAWAESRTLCSDCPIPCEDCPFAKR